MQPEEAAPATVVEVVGSVTVLNERVAKWRPVKVGSGIYPNDLVRTGDESKVEFIITEEQRFLVTENSLISVNFPPVKSVKERHEIVVAFGRIFCNLRKLSSKDQFLFSTPTATAAIRGTAFELSVSRKTGESSLSVVKGKVAVSKRKTLNQVWKTEELSARAQAVQPQLNLADMQNTVNVLNFMQSLSYDLDKAEKKEFEEKIRLRTRELVREARAKGLSRAEAVRLVEKETETLRMEAEKEQARETIIAAGEVAHITPAENAVFISDLGSEDIGFLIRMYGETKIKNALSSPRDTNLRSETPRDSISSLLTDVVKMEMERRARAKKKEEKESKKQNLNPVITSEPIREAFINNLYVYQVAATDIDGDVITFSLVDAPPEMSINPSSGIISWTPATGGTFKVKVKADDGRRGTAFQEFQISAKEGLAVELKIEPESGTKNTRFHYTASVATQEACTFRWDFDGDGKWDFPGDDSFSPQNKIEHAFDKPRRYWTRLEVKSSSGLSTTITRGVHVIAQPCRIKAGPPRQGHMAEEIPFVVKYSDPDGQLLFCTWDFDNDGKADWKGNSPAPVTHSYGRTGKFNAVFTVQCRDGKIVKDTTIVTIYNAPPIAKAPEKLVTLFGGMTTFDGIGSDPDGSIRIFEWDFDGDGKFDWNSNIMGIANHTYKKPGTYKAVFRVTSSDGKQATAETLVRVVEPGSAELKN